MYFYFQDPNTTIHSYNPHQGEIMSGFLKRVMIILLLFLLIASTGCYRRMYHPTKNRSQWAADHAECEKMVRESIREAPDAYDYKDEHRLIRKCMQKKGWRFKL
jgi:hypothetical protein